MNVDAQLDALGFDGGFVFVVEVMWVLVTGLFFIYNLGVALFRSPANTHAI